MFVAVLPSGAISMSAHVQANLFRLRLGTLDLSITRLED